MLCWFMQADREIRIEKIKIIIKVMVTASSPSIHGGLAIQ